MQQSRQLGSLAAAAAFLLAALAAAPALAHPGDLDTQFGTNGLVEPGLPFGEEGAESVVVARDGSIYVGGATGSPSFNQPFDFLLAHYTADGQPDTAWGNHGRITTDFGGDDDIHALALQKDGKIVAAGSADLHQVGQGRSFALARYLPDGSLDQHFGTAGKVVTAFGPGNQEIAAVAIQGDGKIVVPGYTTAATTGHPHLATIARYLSNGQVDTHFGAGGIATTLLGGDTSTFSAVAVQKNGRIVAAGSATANNVRHFIVARFLKNGSADSSFGSGGSVDALFGGTDSHATAAAVQSDGKIVAAGMSNVGGHYDFAVARFTGKGQLDASYGSQGRALVDFGSDDEARAMALQSDGKVVVAGSGGPSGSPSGFALARLTKKGGLDASFGQGGKVFTALVLPGGADAVALQKGSRILVAGYEGQIFVSGIAMARYLGK